MPSSAGDGRLFSRRFALILAAQGLVTLGLASRMRHLQLVKSSEFRRVAEENRINLQPIAPRRSNILGRDGSLLATVRPAYSVMLDRGHVHDPHLALDRLLRLVAIPREQQLEIHRTIDESPTLRIIPLLEDADYDTVARIAANAPSLPGVDTYERWVRSYPDGPVFAHAIGYVGPISPEDFAQDPTLAPLRSVPDIRIGKRGVERNWDERLRGRPGVVRVEVNALGRPIRELRREPATPGRPLVLTLDRNLQSFAKQRLGDHAAAAIVMDVQNGDLLCMLSTPAFDPNLFSVGISHTDWNALRAHPRKPLIDRANAGEYAPGSTFKLPVALAALATNKRSPHSPTLCTGSTRLGDTVFHCWKKYGHGRVAMRDAIKQSCDVYFYRTAEALGPTPIADMATRLGLGQRYEIGMTHSRPGLIPTRAWKESTIGETWHTGDSFNTGIGQGYTLTTPLQLAVMAARVANGRRKVLPRLTIPRSTTIEPPLDDGPLDINPTHLDLIRDAMFAVCNETGGTAYGSRIPNPETAMAGKTGTSQVRRITQEQRRRGLPEQDEIPWQFRNHAMFVGYAPMDAPKYAVAVVVEHGGSGSRAAAPVARDLLIQAIYGEASARLPGSAERLPIREMQG